MQTVGIDMGTEWIASTRRQTKRIYCYRKWITGGSASIRFWSAPNAHDPRFAMQHILSRIEAGRFAVGTAIWLWNKWPVMPTQITGHAKYTYDIGIPFDASSLLDLTAISSPSLNGVTVEATWLRLVNAITFSVAIFSRDSQYSYYE